MERCWRVLWALHGEKHGLMSDTSEGCKTASEEHGAWFRQARFGMFIHWGLYSILGRGEWVMRQEGIPPSEYEPLAERWDLEGFDAGDWARLAKRAGMGYVVFTTKHHDGFCLFDSELTDYSSGQRGPKRDFVREVVDACRREGLRVGLYYSLGDWHFPPYLAVARGDASAVPELKQYLHGQVRELLTNYGRIDVLWYDGAWYDGRYLSAETLAAEDMNAMARRLQPHILINDRSGPPGDFDTCEHVFKPSPAGRDWEMCTPVHDLWGYCEHDYNYKTVNQLIFWLVSCAVHGGNFLLNVGPKQNGRVPREQVARLEAVGEWMQIHRESVCGAERLASPFFAFGRVTRRGRRLYLHTFYWPGERMVLANLDERTFPGRIGSAKVAASVLTTGQSASCRWDGERLVLEGLPHEPPHKADTVVTLDVSGS